MKKILFISILLFSSYFYSQKNITELELELINLSLKKSYSLKNAQNDLAIDSIESKSIKQNFIPTLSMDGFYSYGVSDFNVDIPSFQLPIADINLFEGDSEFQAKGNIFNTNLTAKALLFSGMQVSYGSKASKEKIKAKNFLLEKDKAEIIMDVIDTYDKIELLNKSKVVLEESEKRLAKEKEKVLNAIKNGLATPYDREKITAAELKIASKKLELFGNLSLLYLKLSMHTGVEQTALENYNFELKPWILHDNSQTFENRPELKALEASIKAYEYKLKMNKSLFLPKVQAFATLSYFNLFDTSIKTPYNGLITEQPINLDLNYFKSFPTYLVGVGFQWEIFNGLKHSNEIQKTSIEKNIAQNNKIDATEKLELFEKKVKIEFDIKNKQIEMKEKEMEVASNTLNLAIKSFQEGLISITDRLDAETSYQEAVLEYYKAIVMQRRAALELLNATGSLTTLNLN